MVVKINNLEPSPEFKLAFAYLSRWDKLKEMLRQPEITPYVNPHWIEGYAAAVRHILAAMEELETGEEK